MHPSNNLLLPILRKHGDRLLKAQIEAMVKELSWEEQELFLRRQLDASIEEIREKLAKSYPDYAFFTNWQPDKIRKCLKGWIFVLSGQRNYLLGIDDFSLVVTAYELGKMISLTGFTPSKQTEMNITSNNQITINQYRLLQRPINPAHRLPTATKRNTNNYLEDFLHYLEGKVMEPPMDGELLLSLILTPLMEKQDRQR
jgi:hypothetical protein